MTTRRVGVEGVHTYYRIDFLLHQHYLRRLNNNNVDRRENAPALARVGGTELRDLALALGRSLISAHGGTAVRVRLLRPRPKILFVENLFV
jgi:hypothetical protein